MLQEFKTFVMRGNVLDLAVGVVIGAAFGKIVDSLVKDVIMPPVGLLLGNVDFSNLFVTLKAGSKAAGPYETLKAAQEAGAVTLNLGVFFNAIVGFLIIAFAIFMLIKTINKVRLSEVEPAPAPAPSTKDCRFCYSPIPLQATRCPCCTSRLDEPAA